MHLFMLQAKSSNAIKVPDLIKVANSTTAVVKAY